MTRLATINHAGARRQTIRAAVLIATLATGIGLGVAIAQAHDIRLDEAFAALQKATALLEASSAGVVSPQTQHKFDSHVAKALADIQDAMDHIAAAAAAVDTDGGPQ